MKAKEKKVYEELERTGCPVMPGGNWSAASVFEISGETAKNGPDGLPWADYYLMHSDALEFGVNKTLCEKLRAAGLSCEWINPGVLGVYPN